MRLRSVRPSVYSSALIGQEIRITAIKSKDLSFEKTGSFVLSFFGEGFWLNFKSFLLIIYDEQLTNLFVLLMKKILEIIHAAVLYKFYCAIY